jgi:hypothetical protein
MQTTASTSVESQEVNTWNAWASWANNAYIGFLTLTLVATVLIVVFNNKLNKAKDASYLREKQASDERIATAKATGEQAKRDAADADERAATANREAGRANERAEKLESANLALRGQVATLESAASDAKKDVALLQKAASDAKAALSQQEELTAKAQAEVIELQEGAAPRHLTREQIDQLSDRLRDEFMNRSLKGLAPIGLQYAEKDPEAAAFAYDLREAMDRGWFNTGGEAAPVDLAPFAAKFGRIFSFGVTIRRFLSLDSEGKPLDKHLAEAQILEREFARVGVKAEMLVTTSLPPQGRPIWVVVGTKPNSRFEAQQERLRKEQEEQMLRRVEELHRREEEQRRQTEKIKPPKKP